MMFRIFIEETERHENSFPHRHSRKCYDFQRSV